jgi:hypothetical protein
VQRLVRAGLVDRDLLAAADHEADLLAHPYIDLMHLELARLRLNGLDGERQALLARATPGVRQGRWRPRGPRSALRARGRAATRAAYLRAWVEEGRKGEQP